MRERWIAAVLATDNLKPGCKNVLWALSRQMDDRGRVTYPRAELAADVGVRSVQRVSDRIREAKDAEFLSRVGGGVNGTIATYDAMIPEAELPRLRIAGRRADSRPQRRPTEAAEPAGAGKPLRPRTGRASAPARARFRPTPRHPTGPGRQPRSHSRRIHQQQPRQRGHPARRQPVDPRHRTTSPAAQRIADRSASAG